MLQVNFYSVIAREIQDLRLVNVEKDNPVKYPHNS